MTQKWLAQEGRWFILKCKIKPYLGFESYLVLENYLVIGGLKHVRKRFRVFWIALSSFTIKTGTFSISLKFTVCYRDIVCLSSTVKK